MNLMAPCKVRHRHAPQITSGAVCAFLAPSSFCLVFFVIIAPSYDRATHFQLKVRFHSWGPFQPDPFGLLEERCSYITPRTQPPDMPRQAIMTGGKRETCARSLPLAASIRSGRVLAERSIRAFCPRK